MTLLNLPERMCHFENFGCEPVDTHSFFPSLGKVKRKKIKNIMDPKHEGYIFHKYHPSHTYTLNNKNSTGVGPRFGFGIRRYDSDTRTPEIDFHPIGFGMTSVSSTVVNYDRNTLRPKANVFDIKGILDSSPVERGLPSNVTWFLAQHPSVNPHNVVHPRDRFTLFEFMKKTLLGGEGVYKSEAEWGVLQYYLSKYDGTIQVCPQQRGSGENLKGFIVTGARWQQFFTKHYNRYINTFTGTIALNSTQFAAVLADYTSHCVTADDTSPTLSSIQCIWQLSEPKFGIRRSSAT